MGPVWVLPPCSARPRPSRVSQGVPNLLGCPCTPLGIPVWVFFMEMGILDGASGLGE